MICLSWCKDQQLKSYIDETLSFLYPTRVDPPSLVEICVYKIRRHIQESGIAQRVDEVPGHLKQRYPLLSPLSLWFQGGPCLMLPLIIINTLFLLLQYQNLLVLKFYVRKKRV